MLGSVDEQVVVGDRNDDEVFGDESGATTRQKTFATSTVAPLIEQFSADARVDT